MQVNEMPKIFGLTTMRALAAFAALLGIVGMLLPWISWDLGAYHTSYNVNSNSIWTGLLSIIALVVIFSDKIVAMVAQSAPNNGAGSNTPMAQLSSANSLVKGWSNIILLILGAVILLLAWDNLSQINTAQSQLERILGMSIGTVVSAGAGLWLTIVAGVLILVSVILGLVLLRERLVPSMSAMGPTPAPAPYQMSPQPQNGPSFPTSIPVSTAPNTFCQSCGAPLTGSAFCGVCGNKVK